MLLTLHAHRPQGGPGPRWPALGLLTLAVLSGHLWLLHHVRGPHPEHHAPGHASAGLPGPSSTWQVRSLPAGAAPRVEPDASSTAPHPPAPMPMPTPKPIPAAAAATPAPAPATVVAAAQSPPPGTAPPADPATLATVATPAAAVAPGASVTPVASAAPTAEPAQASPGAAGQAAGLAWRLPAPVRLSYASAGPEGGVAELSWRTDGQRYEARWESAAQRWQHSSGVVGPSGVQPQRYAQRQSRAEEASHFSPENGQVVFSRNTPQASWVDGTQDPLSALVQLASLLAARPQAYPAGAQVHIPTAGTRDLQMWTFHMRESSTLELAGQTLQVWRMERLPTSDYDARLEVWLAPRLDWLPARVRLTQANGRQTEHQLNAWPAGR